MVRRLAIAAAVLLLLLAALVVATSFLLETTAAREYVERRVEGWLHMPVEITGRIRPSLSLTPSFAADGLRVGSGDPPLAEIGRLVLSLDLRDLLVGRLHLVAVGVRDGRIAVEPSEEPSDLDVELEDWLGLLPDETRAEDVRLEVGLKDGERFEIAIERGSMGRCGDPFELRGRAGDLSGVLAGTLGCPGGMVFSVEDLRAEVGSSRFAGSFRFEIVEPHPRIEGEIRAERLALADFRPEVASDLGSDAPLLDDPLVFDFLDALGLDLDLRFEADALVLRKATVERARGRIVLAERGLGLVVEHADLWEGTAAWNVRVDGARRPTSVAVQLSSDSLSVAAFEGIDATGHFDFDLDVKGRGRTLREVLASLDGRMRVVLEPTVYREAPVGALGQDLFGIAFSQMDDAQRGVVNCAVWLTDFSGGVGTAGVLIDTPGATLGGTGAINFRKWEAALVLRPAPKRASIGALKTPIRIAGPLDDLGATLDPAGAALDTSFMVALGVVAPPLMVVPLIDLGSGDENACEAALAAADPRTFERKGQWGSTLDAARKGGQWLQKLLPESGE